MEALKPREVVDQLDKYIIGQLTAKKAVAIALRNRWRRQQLRADLKNEVYQFFFLLSMFEFTYLKPELAMI